MKKPRSVRFILFLEKTDREKQEERARIADEESQNDRGIFLGCVYVCVGDAWMS